MIYFNDFYCAGSAAFPAGRSLYKSTWAPYFFFISFFFFGSILRQGIQMFFFFLTAPPAAGIPTYISPPPKKTKIWAFFHFVWGKENFKLYWIFFLFFLWFYFQCANVFELKKNRLACWIILVFYVSSSLQTRRDYIDFCPDFLRPTPFSLIIFPENFDFVGIKSPNVGTSCRLSHNWNL